MAGIEFFLCDLHLSSGRILDECGRATGQLLLAHGGGCNLHPSLRVLVEPLVVSQFEGEAESYRPSL